MHYNYYFMSFFHYLVLEISQKLQVLGDWTEAILKKKKEGLWNYHIHVSVSPTTFKQLMTFHETWYENHH